MSAPSRTSPPPQPVPRMTPNTRARAGAGAIDGLRQGKAVGIVGEPDRAAEMRLEVALERLAVEPRRVGVLHQPARRRQRARHADADRCRSSAAGAFLEHAHHLGRWPDGRAVVVARRRHAMLGQRASARAPAPRPRSWCRRGRCPRAAGPLLAFGQSWCAPSSRAMARPTLSGATPRLAANTSSRDSSPARCSSTARESSGVPARARTSSGSSPVSLRKRSMRAASSARNVSPCTAMASAASRSRRKALSGSRHR